MNFVSLISSGIDSPVATYLMAPKSDQMILIHADNRPYTDDREIQNFKTLFKHLKNIMKCHTTGIIIPHGYTLLAYQKTCSQSRFTCVICKRMLIRYAAQIAEKKFANAIIMGDTLGQVASQTLKNLRIVDQVVSIPILRPLIGFDKEETIHISKQIGVYELSIKPSAGCLAVPTKPATQATLRQIKKEEATMNVKGLVADAIEKAIYM